MKLELEEIIPPYIQIERNQHTETFTSFKAFERGLQIARAISEKEMLENIIDYLEGDLSRLKRHLKTFKPEAMR